MTDIRVDVDGREPLFFPPDTDEETIQRVTRNYALGLYGPRKAPEASAMLDTAKNVAGSGATGLVRGLSGLAGLPRSAVQGYDAAKWWLGDKAYPYLPEQAQGAYRALSDLGRGQEGASRFLPSQAVAQEAMETVVPPTAPARAWSPGPCTAMRKPAAPTATTRIVASTHSAWAKARIAGVDHASMMPWLK